MMRSTETALLTLVTLLTWIGYAMTKLALDVQAQHNPLASLPQAVTLTIVVVLPFWLIHALLCWQRIRQSQLILPLLKLLVVFGLMMLWRLNQSPLIQAIYQIEADSLFNNQLLRGLYLGAVAMLLLVWQPSLVERVLRNRWSIFVASLGSLFLLLLAALIGAADGLSVLSFGVLSSVQLTELLKVALIFVIAWYVDQVGTSAEISQMRFGFINLPRLQAWLPSITFVAVASLLFFRLSDLGAILVLLPLFITLLYLGVEPKAFQTILWSGMLLAAAAFTLLSRFVSTPLRVLDRWQAFRDPWSRELSVWYGEPIYLSSGVQLQQAIYGTTAGGFWGQGLGFGQPDIIPAAISDFILAAIAEEMGLIVTLALIMIFLLLLWRIARVAIHLREDMLFERLLIVGIAVHLGFQFLIMAAGTWNLFIMTGITVPFLSQGGVALAVNLAEVGIVLAIAGRHATSEKSRFYRG